MIGIWNPWYPETSNLCSRRDFHQAKASKAGGLGVTPPGPFFRNELDAFRPRDDASRHSAFKLQTCQFFLANTVMARLWRITGESLGYG